MVERSIAWLVRGNRRLRYHGITRNNHWLHHRAAALNLRRLITLGPATPATDSTTTRQPNSSPNHDCHPRPDHRPGTRRPITPSPPA